MGFRDQKVGPTRNLRGPPRTTMTFMISEWIGTFTPTHDPENLYDPRTLNPMDFG